MLVYKKITGLTKRLAVDDLQRLRELIDQMIATRLVNGSSAGAAQSLTEEVAPCLS